MNARAYYNEFDPFAAQWLRNLIAAGLIAAGDVDERSIADVRAADLAGYTQCHFFAGIGGWSAALRLAGWPDDRPVWTGSCPCQPFSAAGKRQGFGDARHLWPVWRELVRSADDAIGPVATLFGEQVASATDWLGLVRGDLEALGRAVGAMPVEAASAGADHLRDRYFYVADLPGQRREGAAGSRIAPRHGGIEHGGDVDDARLEGWWLQRQRAGERFAGADGLADTASGGQQAQREFWTRKSNAGRRGSDVGHAEGRVGRLSTRSFGREGAQPDRPSEEYDWVLGADGKARRVKSGIRLLAHGVRGRMAVRRTIERDGVAIEEEHWYSRVGALKGFGNAIDLRPAAQFIGAYMDLCDG